MLHHLLGTLGRNVQLPVQVNVTFCFIQTSRPLGVHQLCAIYPFWYNMLPMFFEGFLRTFPISSQNADAPESAQLS